MNPGTKTAKKRKILRDRGIPVLAQHKELLGRLKDYSGYTWDDLVKETGLSKPTLEKALDPANPAKKLDEWSLIKILRVFGLTPESLDDSLETSQRKSVGDLLQQLRLEIATPSLVPTLLETVQLELLAKEDVSLLKELARGLSSRGSICYFDGLHTAAYLNDKAAARLFLAAADYEETLRCVLNSLRALTPLAVTKWIRDAAFMIQEIMERQGVADGCLFARFAFELGTLCFNYGKRENAVILWRDAEKTFKSYQKQHAETTGIKENVARLLYTERRLGHVRGLGDFEAGRGHLLETIRNFRSENDKQGAGNTCFSLVCLMDQCDRPGEALEFLSEHGEEICSGSAWTRIASPGARGFLTAKIAPNDEADDLFEKSFRDMKRLGMCPPLLQNSKDWPLFRPDLQLGLDHPLVSNLGLIRRRGEFPFTDIEFASLFKTLNSRLRQRSFS